MIWVIIWMVGVFVTNAYIDMQTGYKYSWKDLLLKQACIILWFLYLPCAIIGTVYWDRRTKRENAKRRILRDIAAKERLCPGWTEETYRDALKELSPIFLAEPGTEEANRAATLIDQIEAYEEVHYKIPEPKAKKVNAG